jgi:hypothetical protein
MIHTPSRSAVFAHSKRQAFSAQVPQCSRLAHLHSAIRGAPFHHARRSQGDLARQALGERLRPMCCCRDQRRQLSSLAQALQNVSEAPRNLCRADIGRAVRVISCSKASAIGYCCPQWLCRRTKGKRPSDFLYLGFAVREAGKPAKLLQSAALGSASISGRSTNVCGGS